jgi:hypothetical protein
MDLLQNKLMITIKLRLYKSKKSKPTLVPCLPLLQKHLSQVSPGKEYPKTQQGMMTDRMKVILDWEKGLLPLLVELIKGNKVNNLQLLLTKTWREKVTLVLIKKEWMKLHPKAILDRQCNPIIRITWKKRKMIIYQVLHHHLHTIHWKEIRLNHHKALSNKKSWLQVTTS